MSSFASFSPRQNTPADRQSACGAEDILHDERVMRWVWIIILGAFLAGCDESKGSGQGGSAASLPSWERKSDAPVLRRPRVETSYNATPSTPVYRPTPTPAPLPQYGVATVSGNVYLQLRNPRRIIQQGISVALFAADYTEIVERLELAAELFAHETEAADWKASRETLKSAKEAFETRGYTNYAMKDPISGQLVALDYQRDRERSINWFNRRLLDIDNLILNAEEQFQEGLRLAEDEGFLFADYQQVKKEYSEELVRVIRVKDSDWAEMLKIVRGIVLSKTSAQQRSSSDEDGWFEFEGVPEGTYTLLATINRSHPDGTPILVVQWALPVDTTNVRQRRLKLTKDNASVFYDASNPPERLGTSP